MQLELKTWNGSNINDGTNYQAWIPEGQLVNLSADGISVPRSNEFPFLSGSVLPEHVLVISVAVAAGASIHSKRDTLKTYFNIMDSDPHDLVAWDTADGDRPWYVRGIPVRIVETEINEFSITLLLEAPIWKLVTAGTDTWNLTATGQTNAVTNLGNINVKPVYEFTPTAAKTGGLQYRRWVPIYSNLDAAFVAPFDITSGGFDTATLTTAKMQADGDDFLVMVDGVFVDRWLNSMDTAATKCWINLNLSPRKEGTTSVTISNVGAVTTISFAKTRANLAFLIAMAKATNKVVLIDSEAFTFTSVNLVTYQLTGCTRAMKDTTADTHTAPDTVRWIEHDIWILYGDSTLTAPDVDDDLKPMFDLGSTNTSWDYATSGFVWDNESNRPGAWKPEVNATKTGLSHIYTDSHGFFTNPASELGMAMVGMQTEYGIISEVAQVSWLLTHPCFLTDVTYSGEKYYAGLSWPEIVGLQYIEVDASRWFTDENEAQPTNELVWESFGPRVVALSTFSRSIRFVMDGSLRPAKDERAMVQFSSITVTIDSAELPTVSIGPEQAIVYFDFTFTNNTTGEYFKVAMPCKINDTITVDAENKKAYTDDGARVPVILSTDREAWLDMRPGSNTFQFDDTGIGNTTIVTTHRDRNL